MSFNRWTFARRCVQIAAVLLLISPLVGVPVFIGNLAAADIAGLPLVDPLAALQAVLASHVRQATLLLPAAGVALFYLMIGGRTFCAWVCPVYLLGEAGDRLRRFLETGEKVLPLSAKQWLLLLVIAGTLITGLPLFETFSPIGMVTRALAYGSYLGVSCLSGLLLVEVLIARRIWCRSLCPLGGFYALLGRLSPVKVAFIPGQCTDCGDCSRVCPVEEVLEPVLARTTERVVSGECTRCGACIDACSHGALGLGTVRR